MDEEEGAPKENIQASLAYLIQYVGELHHSFLISESEYESVMTCVEQLLLGPTEEETIH